MPRDATRCGAVVAGVLCRTLQCWTLQCCSLDAVCCKVVYIAVVKLCMYIAVLLSAHCGTVGCTWGCDAARRGLRVCRGEVGRGAVRWRSAGCGAHCTVAQCVLRRGALRHGPLRTARSAVCGPQACGGPPTWQSASTAASVYRLTAGRSTAAAGRKRARRRMLASSISPAMTKTRSPGSSRYRPRSCTATCTWTAAGRNSTRARGPVCRDIDRSARLTECS